MPRRAPQYARGRRAWGHDARTGERVLLRDLVRDGHTGLPVTRESYEPKHPQETPVEIYDPQALRRPAPDLDRIGYTVTWPTGDFAELWAVYPPLTLNFHVAAVEVTTGGDNVVAGSDNVVAGSSNVVVPES